MTGPWPRLVKVGDGGMDVAPLTVTVTTRIITFLVGDPYKHSFTTVTVRGAISNINIYIYVYHVFIYIYIYNNIYFCCLCMSMNLDICIHTYMYMYINITHTMKYMLSICLWNSSNMSFD